MILCFDRFNMIPSILLPDSECFVFYIFTPFLISFRIDSEPSLYDIQREIINKIPKCLIKKGWAISIFSAIKNNCHFLF